MKRCALVLAALAAIFGLATLIAAQESAFGTALTPKGQGIVRHPPAADFAAERGKLDALPVYDPAKTAGWQVDLRSRDLSGLDLAGRLSDLLNADFDSKTVWPKSLPAGFDPAAIMAAGINPGLGVRALHKSGITGRGVGIAIIDQCLLVDHAEYKDRLRLYEEIHVGDSSAAMHGPAVASIAVGKTVGVAPEADLYYIAETHGTVESGQFVFDFQYLAESIDRVLEINKNLPADRKIRVISISVGWDPRQKGYVEVTAAVERAKKDGIFVVSSSLSATYAGKLNFHGLGRDPLTDPEKFAFYRHGLWWTNQFWAMTAGSPELLLVPMDSRGTASPTGNDDYVFYRQGGWSWSIPYIAGLYALACQVKPDITPELFWAAALKTGDAVDIPARRTLPSEADLAKQIEKILDERMAFMKQRSPDVPLEKALAEAYSRLSGKKAETISEADFRAWAVAGPIREMALGDTKPKTLKTIVNPARLLEALKKSTS
ncbi:MAG: S8/S53 family peptidase [Candidatus Aminicenantes bacterium]|nr:S8/S53 family peptidase [Candidatus Aminicenantes bacterium]